MRRRAVILLAGGLACAVLAQPALSQTLGQGAATDIPWGRMIGALVLCLALAVAGALALRSRLGGAGLPPALARLKLPVAGLRLPEAGPRRLQLIETVRLSHQIDICLLRYDDGHLVVAATPQGVTVVAGGHPAPSAEPQ